MRMRQILAIAQTYVYIALRTPITIIMAFVMPIIYTAVLGLALAPSDPEADNRTPILVVDEDRGSLVEEVKLALDASEVVRLHAGSVDDPHPATRAEALAALDDYGWILILPAGFSDGVMAGESSSAQFHVANNDQTTTAAEQEIEAILSKIGRAANVARAATGQAAQIKPFASVQAEAAYFDHALGLARESLAEAAVGVVSEAATAAGLAANESPDGPVQSSPGSLVMFGMVTLLSSAIVLVEERNSGTLRRLVTSPLSNGTILAGKTLGPLTVGVIQMTVLILVGQFAFGVQWGRSPLALVIMVLAFDLAAVSLGILLSTLVRTTDQAVAVMIATSMATAALGGAWWPMDIVPPFMKTIGHFFPTAWAMDGFQDIIIRGAGVAEILTPALVLAGFAALFFGLGIWRFKYE